MTAPRLSVVVVTRDEEDRIRACLESVAWADELVVVDAESTDKTASIARELTDHVIARPWPGFAAQKNFGLEQARGAWILSLDADETVSPALREDIERVVRDDGPCDGYAVPRRNIVWGRWVRHGGLYPDWQLRLFRRGRGRFGARAVHAGAQLGVRVSIRVQLRSLLRVSRSKVQMSTTRSAVFELPSTSRPSASRTTLTCSLVKRTETRAMSPCMPASTTSACSIAISWVSSVWPSA